MRLLKIPRVTIGVIAHVVTVFSIIYIEPIIAFIYKAHGLNNDQIGATFMLIPFAMMCLGFPLSSYLSKRVEKGAVIIVAALFMTLFFTLAGPSEMLPFPEESFWLRTVELTLLLEFLICATYLNFAARQMPEMTEGAMEALGCED